MAPIRKKEAPLGPTLENENREEISDRWKSLAENRQQEICDLVINYDWELYKNNELQYLAKKVEYILFGLSQNIIDANNVKVIKNVCEKVISVGNKSSEDGICMAFIYIFWPLNDSELQNLPVFKVPKDKTSSDVYFIDINARIYEDWKDFLNNNQFPSCEYCYPVGGKYITDSQNKVILEFQLSPASRTSKKLVQCLDYANAGLALGTTVVTATSLFVPLTSPLLAATAWAARGICAYSTFRSGTTLYDRQTHKQNIGFNDSESRSCWLAIGSTALGAAASSASRITDKMARSGQLMGRMGCTTTNVLTYSNVVWNGAGLLNHLHGLMEKRKNQKLSSLDVIHLSASLLLFAHSAVTVKTAQSIIENAQNNVLQEFENSLRSNKHKKMFRRVAENTKGQDNIEGNARVIRALKHINNKDDFLSALIRLKKQFGPVGNTVSLSEEGFIVVDGQLHVEPIKLVSVSKAERIQLLNATKNYARNHISEAEFRTLTQTILGEIPSITQSTSNNSPSLKQLLGLGQLKFNLSSQMKASFSYPLLNAYQRKELMVILKIFAESDHEHILQMASILFKALGWTTGLQYVEITYFICGLIRNLANESLQEGNESLQEGNESLQEGNECHNESGMSASEYCKVAVQEFLQDPQKLGHIFQKVRKLWEVTREKKVIPTHKRNVSLFEFAQISSILLRVDIPLWLRCIEFSQEMLGALGLKKLENIVYVLKDLCSYIFKTIQYMEKKHAHPVTWTASADKLWIEANQQRTNEYCNTILDTLSNDKQIRESLMEEIWTSNSLISERLEIESTCQRYTKQQPLEIKRTFWNGEQIQLLSEEEILHVCKETLELTDWPSINNIEYDGCNALVNIDDKLIIVECSIEEEKIRAYVDITTS